ncbi:MAG: uncharacterized protein QOE17_1839 [Gaiellales bacterium]|nr:uncharacterized protein [Gaiellales bacterium]
MSQPVSLAELRRRAVAAQGYAARSRRARTAEVEAAIARLGAVQLDSISAVERSHRIALASRVGVYPRGSVSKLLKQGRIFEYWAHEACLIPIADWPLYRLVMLSSDDHPWWGDVLKREAILADHVLSEIRDRGPLGSRHFEGESEKGMWSQKPAKKVLEALWNSGRLVVAERRNFQRMYDLPERVIPDELLGAPVPGEEEMLRTLSLRAVEARGVLTERGIVEHNRLRGGVARIRPHVEALVADGLLRRLEVADGGATVLVPADSEPDGSTTAPVLLSPFDNLLWDRPFAERVIGFSHLIEVYKPQPERVYGYYVLPFLLGDRIVGRVDLRNDRSRKALRVVAVHREPTVRWGARHDDGLDRALERLSTTVGSSTILRE